MGKFRSKLKGQTKGKRWKKGQSSSSNPDIKKHRDVAKTRFFQENLGPSGLTSDALRKHDAVVSFAPNKKTIEDDIESLGTTFETMRTFASDWSDCSNASFGRLMRDFRSNSAHHKEMLAVLAAITEVIKQNGGKETSTEYYAALMTTLEEVSENKVENSLFAVLGLLSMGIKSVPRSVLRTQFTGATTKFLEILNEYSAAENNVVVKSILVCLTTFLRAIDLSEWEKPHTLQVFEAILCPYSIHSKPKWRKSAQQSIAAILKASSFQMNEEGLVITTIQHPGAARVAEFCISSVEETFGSSAQEVKISGKGKSGKSFSGQTTLLHIFELMKEVIHTFPKTQIKKSCETILKIMTLNYPLVTSCGLQVLHGLFSTQSASVPAKLNAQLITALYDYQPAVMDVQPTLAWLMVLQQAHVHLADVDVTLSMQALPKIITTCAQLWLSEKTEIMYAATRSLEMLLKDAIAPVCETAHCAKDHQLNLSKCFQVIESGLGYQFNKAWPQVLHIITVMFQVAGKTCSEPLLGCLKSLAELRDSYKFSYNSELEYAVGAAVRSMGPQTVLDVISIKKDNNVLNLERSWLLPILKENIHSNCTLAYFISYMLPLTIHCQRHAAQLKQSSDAAGAHSYELLYSQLWHLLPSFCNAPTDIAASFKNVAKVLGTAISDRKELRLPAMAALRKLITFAAADEANAQDAIELSKFAKNYLPILFNVYTTKPVGTDEEGQRLCALDTIKVYLKITKPELNEQLFKTAMERFKTTDSIEVSDRYIKESLLDLIKVLCPYQPCESISTLYDELVKNLGEIASTKEQKKVYRLLEEICGNDSSEGCKAFVAQNRKAVQKLLMKSLETAAVSSKGTRLRCLLCLVKAQPHLDHESNFIRSIIPEAILCFKDINEKCRISALQLLIAIGELLMSKKQIQQFVTMVIVGLGGQPTMMSATVLALASIVHNFSGGLGQENIKAILDSIFKLMKVSTREIVASCLSFIKVYTSSFPSPMVLTHLPQIVSSLCLMTEDCKKHFRTKVRDIFDRLIRKYGCDSIEPHVPASDALMKKRLKNLRKINARKLKKKNDKSAAEEEDENNEWENESFVMKTKPKSIEDILADSDSEADEMEAKSVKATTKKMQKSKKTTKTWIQEDSEDIVDFIDPSATSKITATRPGAAPASTHTQQNSVKDRGFKTANDGRLIIDIEADSDDNKKSRTDNLSDNSDSEDDKRSAAETLILGNRKRKRDDAISEYSKASSRQSKYQTGGSGIHRAVPAGAASVRSEAGHEYKSKKAKGDVKKEGKLDPYAYLPLNRNALNKRKKMKNAGRFKNIVRGAKVGATKGAKFGKRKMQSK